MKRAMHSLIDRRTFLRHGVAGAAGGLLVGAVPAGRARAASKGPQIFGSGRIGASLEGRTIPSPSDFGFTADPSGGTFVCSMFGETSGFKGCTLMTVQGNVTPASLQIFKGKATFSGKVDILVLPDVFFNSGPYLSLGDMDYQCEAVLGGPGKATIVVHIGGVTGTVGGDTGGVVEFGRIERKRIRR